MALIRDLDLSDSRQVSAYIDVHHRSRLREVDVPWGRAEFAVLARGDAWVSRQGFLAYNGAEVVGGAVVEFSEHDNLEIAVIEIDVLPELRRRGIGSRLLGATESAVRAAGRRVLVAEVSRSLGEDASAGSAFARSHGFEVDTVIAVRALAWDAQVPRPPGTAPAGYRLRSWWAEPPPEYADQLAALRSVMNSEAPAGDLRFDNERWTAGRIRHEVEQLRQANCDMLTVVAIADNTALAGHTQLVIPRDTTTALQWDTLVLRAHRGHGLGLALKTEELHLAAGHLTGHRRIVTWNDASNAPMIAINEALGYRLVGHADEFVKTL